jgi:hypothetical protein
MSPCGIRGSWLLAPPNRGAFLLRRRSAASRVCRSVMTAARLPARSRDRHGRDPATFPAPPFRARLSFLPIHHPHDVIANAALWAAIVAGRCVGCQTVRASSGPPELAASRSPADRDILEAFASPDLAQHDARTRRALGVNVATPYDAAMSRGPAQQQKLTNGHR